MPSPREIQIEIHGENDTVVFKIREPLMLKPTDTVIPWDAMEAAYCGILQARQLQRAQRAGKIGIAPPDAVPPLASTRPN